MQIGEVLRTARRAAGMKSGELATLLGTTIFVLSRVEHEKQPFRDEWIPLLPPDIRRPVVDALASYHAQRVDDLNHMVMRRRT